MDFFSPFVKIDPQQSLSIVSDGNLLVAIDRFYYEVPSVQIWSQHHLQIPRYGHFFKFTDQHINTDQTGYQLEILQIFIFYEDVPLVKISIPCGL